MICPMNHIVEYLTKFSGTNVIATNEHLEQYGIFATNYALVHDDMKMKLLVQLP